MTTRLALATSLYQVAHPGALLPLGEQPRWCAVADVVATSIEAARATLSRNTMLATMASTIAAGFAARSELSPSYVLRSSVDLARGMLEAIEAAP